MPTTLKQEYERIIERMETDLRSTPDENWQVIHSQSAGPKAILESQLQTVHPSYSERLRREFLGLGPLAEVLLDPEVTEILLMGEEMILVERDGKLSALKERFLGKRSFELFAQQCLEESGILLNLKRPFGDGQWRGFRVHAAQPPVTRSLCISLRRQAHSSWTLEALVEKGWCPKEWAARLGEWFQDGKSLIVFGDTGSGKTATAEALLNSLPGTCRALILEDTWELRAPNSFSTTLLTRKAVGDLKEISFSELLKQSLRMRPDRLIMGEIRGEEAKDYLLILASGHAGGLATLHASSAQQALIRLEMLVQLGAPQWDLRSVRVLIAQSVHYLIKVGRDGTGRRRLLGISKVDGMEQTGLLLESLDLKEKPHN